MSLAIVDMHQGGYWMTKNVA